MVNNEELQKENALFLLSPKQQHQTTQSKRLFHVLDVLTLSEWVELGLFVDLWANDSERRVPEKQKNKMEHKCLS